MHALEQPDTRFNRARETVYLLESLFIYSTNVLLVQMSAVDKCQGLLAPTAPPTPALWPGQARPAPLLPQ